MLIIILGCQKPAQESAENSQDPGSTAATEDIERKDTAKTAQKVEGPDLRSRLESGLYRGGLKLAIHDNTVSGYYEDASGWNEQANAPQFSCGYSFTGRYTGSDTIQLTLDGYDNAGGTLEILSRQQIRVSLSLNPCENEGPSTETLQIERPYHLVAVNSIAVPKSYFYSQPDEATRRKAYLVKGDKAEVTDIQGTWYRVSYRGANSVTEGWMPASVFKHESPAPALMARWRSKAGEGYELYYRFYPTNRYKTWSINAFEPQGMTGSFTVDEHGNILLVPCGRTSVTMRVRNDAADAISLMIPGTDTWTAFERQSGTTALEEAGFSIEKRQIITTVNSRILRIPSRATKEEFLNAVCPFEVKPDVLQRGEGTFDILRVSTPEKGSLFYAVVDGNDVTALVTESPIIQRKGIAVGASFGDLKTAIPSITIRRSELEGQVSGATEHCSFSFGYISDDLFDSETNVIPDTVTIKQIIL